MIKDFYTVKELMGILGISRAFAYGLLKNEIPIIRIGKKKILIPGWYIRQLTTEPK